MPVKRSMPDSGTVCPASTPDGKVWECLVFLKNVIDHPLIKVGDFSYYNDFDKPKCYVSTLAPYLNPKFGNAMLIIGKFVQIAHGAKFITSSANHQMDGFSTYPFFIFKGDWQNSYTPNFPDKGDTIVHNDVWIGHNATIMPGIKIGNGAIIGANSVVTKDVPDYTTVAGNPAKIIKKRFDENTIAQLLTISWWDWSIEKITDNISAITSSDIKRLTEL